MLVDICPCPYNKMRKEVPENPWRRILFVRTNKFTKEKKQKKNGEEGQIKRTKQDKGWALKVKRTGYTLRIHTMNCQGDLNNASEFFLSYH